MPKKEKDFRMAPRKRKTPSQEPVQQPKRQAKAKAQRPKAKVKGQSSLSDSFHPSKHPKLDVKTPQNANELSDLEGIFEPAPPDATPEGAASTIQEKTEEKTMDCKEGQNSVTGTRVPDQPPQDAEPSEKKTDEQGGKDQKREDSVMTGEAVADQPLQDAEPSAKRSDGQGGEDQTQEDAVNGKGVPDQPPQDAEPSAKRSDGQGGEDQKLEDSVMTGEAVADRELQDAKPSEKRSDGQGGEDQKLEDSVMTGEAVADRELQDAKPSENKSDGKGGEDQKQEDSVTGTGVPDQPPQDAEPSAKRSDGQGGEDQKQEDSVMTGEAVADRELQDAKPSEKRSDGQGGEDQKQEDSVMTGEPLQDTIAEAEQPAAGEGHGKGQEEEARDFAVPPKFVLNKVPFVEMTQKDIENQPGFESSDIVTIVHNLKSVDPKWRNLLMDLKITQTNGDVLDKICQEAGWHIMLSEYTEFVNTDFGKMSGAEEEAWTWEPDGENVVEDMKDFLLWVADRDSESKRKPDSFLNSLDSIISKISSMDPGYHDVKIAEVVSSMCHAELNKVFNEAWTHESLVDHVRQLRADEGLDDFKFNAFEATASLQSFIRQLLNANSKVKINHQHVEDSGEASFPALSGNQRSFLDLFLSSQFISLCHHIISKSNNNHITSVSYAGSYRIIAISWLIYIYII